MTKREIMKRAIKSLKSMYRVREKYLKEKDFIGVKFMNHEIRASIDLLWHIEVINLDKKRYLEKCLGLK